MEFRTEVSGKNLIVRTGEVAQQANGSCIIQYGETTVLATAVMGQEEGEMDYFPLSVDYEERFYAAGKIKGSRFIKRETRPPEDAVLTGRLIDRSIRPLFNQDSRKAVQLILTVLSIDGENDPDMVALWGAIAALCLSDIEWEGPIAGVRVSLVPKENEEGVISLEKEGEWVLNPTYQAQQKGILNLVVCGTNNRITMLEGDAKEIGNEKIIEGTQYTLEYLDKLTAFFKEIQDKAGKKKVSLLKELTEEEKKEKEELKKMTEEIVEQEAPKYLFDHPLKSKAERIGAAENIRQRVDEILTEKQIGKEKRKKAVDYSNKLIYHQVSKRILDKAERLDGRKLDEIRPLNCQAGVLPRVHGSGLFSRGETQILSVVTLAEPGAEKYLDTMEESGRKSFMHHYNFPPFCSGEVGFVGRTNRREIGHGALVEKGFLPILPKKEDFPYTIRIVSESLSSNGSTSMASACASGLAAMDAGIPISRPIAGIAIGLASEEGEKDFSRYQIITDIQDVEDGPGGMDFKVIGTDQGITAIQMDTKTKGINMDIVSQALAASLEARKKVLNEITKVIAGPRTEISPYAPKIKLIKINPDKIRDVIGPGGKIINEIIDKTGATIDIEQDGTVAITALTEESLNKAVEWVRNITRELKVGEVFQGKINRIMDFGAFAEIVPGQDGLIHVSEMDYRHVNHPDDVVKIGDIVPVKLIEIDHQGRINLSMKALKEKPAFDDKSFNDKPYHEKRPERNNRSYGDKR